MMKRIFILLLIILPASLKLVAQQDEQDLKREVTLYNPFKPTLSAVKKKSYLPPVDDTTQIRPDFTYNITAKPYFPEYTISPINAASLLPDPLPKLYKSWVVIGFGNYLAPFGELSITNERSKKGALGFYARHYSTNGKVKLDNDENVFAGYMDNNASLYGKRFFRKSLLEGSLDFSQKTRYAYGYDPSLNYSPEKKDIRLNYYKPGAELSFSSTTLDSSDFNYDINLDYDFFYQKPDMYRHHAGISTTLATTVKGFYTGTDLEFDFYQPSDSVFISSEYIGAFNPFIAKKTSQWNFRAGFQLLLEKDTSESLKFHFYPDVRFGFSVVPEYINFFMDLSGKLQINDPVNVIGINPYLKPDGTLFNLTNTSHKLILSTGLKGNNGIGGNYLLSASYSFIDDIMFFANQIIFPLLLPPDITGRGNYFIPFTDDGELLRVHGEISGRINDEFTFSGSGNWNKYTLAENSFAWNRPGWDGKIGINYKLRDKIIAGLDITAIGKRKLLVFEEDMFSGVASVDTEEPVHLNINLSAEYRYTKILSFWFKLNNISFKPYYEWSYYPAMRFMGLVGFTYSL